MHRRYKHLNIPTEILRSVVGISEAGSITKAGEKLGLSQPAISSQIKRMEALVGGRIFQKTPTGSSPTELGQLVLGHARRILEANDQLLRLKGSSPRTRSIRLGLCNPYAQLILSGQCKNTLNNVSVYADSSREIVKGMLSGFVDLGLFLHHAHVQIDPKIRILRERQENVVWVRAQNFVLSPGAPIPLVSWPGSIIDDLIIAALERNEISYRIAFSTPDYNAKMAGVSAGLGLTAIPKRLVPANLLCNHDYYLPPLPMPKLMLGASSGELDASRLIKAITNDLFLPEMPAEPAVA